MAELASRMAVLELMKLYYLQRSRVTDGSVNANVCELI